MMTRKTFLATTASALAWVMVGCGDDDTETSGGGGDQGGTTTTGGGGNQGGATTTGTGGAGSGCADEAISNNHGHSVAVPQADIVAGVEDADAMVTYDIQGSSPHSHSVTLVHDDFVTLDITGSVTVTSTTAAGHSHDVRVTCA